MIEVVFLDIDNTILDFDAYVKKAMKDGFELFHLPKYEDYMFQVFENNNIRLWREIEQGKLDMEGLREIRWNLIFDELGIQGDGVTFEDFFRKELNKSAIPENDALEILEYLSSKYIVCAASNGPYKQQMNRIEIGGLTKYFEEIFISENVGASKPTKEFFDTCFSRLEQKIGKKVSPENTVMIGDSLTSDISGGKGYGMKTCLYNKKKKEVSSDVADYIVCNLIDIKGIL